MLVVDEKGFFASAYDVCIETKGFGTVFSTFNYITSMCYENHLRENVILNVEVCVVPFGVERLS